MCHQKMKGVRKYMLTMHNVSMQMPQDWEEVQVTVIRPGPIPTSSPCGNTIPDDDRLIVSLPAAARSVTHTFAYRCVSVLVYGNCAACVLLRFVVPLQPLCLERDVTYTLRLDFRRYQDANSILNGAANAVLLVDSVRRISAV